MHTRRNYSRSLPLSPHGFVPARFRFLSAIQNPAMFLNLNKRESIDRKMPHLFAWPPPPHFRSIDFYPPIVSGTRVHLSIIVITTGGRYTLVSTSKRGRMSFVMVEWITVSVAISEKECISKEKKISYRRWRRDNDCIWKHKQLESVK